METDHDRPTDGKPKIHHQPFYKYENVSAIQCYNAKTGNGHYQNLSFWGYSGTALEMPDHSMANDITVMKCSLGINTGENSIISNSKVWGCRTGMQISTGTLINNMRVEEISEVGLNRYHYEIESCRAKISAITLDAVRERNGMGHYEDLYISGFSGSGISIPYFSIADNITVSNCGLGIMTQIDALISNCRVSYCGIGMSIGTGTSLNNVRVVEILEHGTS